MKIDKSKYKHFSFDLWLTLIKSNPEFKYKRDCVFKDFFEIDKNIEVISKTIRYYDVLSNKISEKTGRHIKYDNIYYHILSSLKVNLDTIDEKKMVDFYLEVEHLFLRDKPILIVPNTVELLYSIKNQGKIINIASNTAFIEGHTLRCLVDYFELSDFFSFQLYSDELKISKPNPLFFENIYNNAMEIQPIEKKDVVHIGDNKFADYEGATKYGFSAILV